MKHTVPLMVFIIFVLTFCSMKLVNSSVTRRLKQSAFFSELHETHDTAVTAFNCTTGASEHLCQFYYNHLSGAFEERRISVAVERIEKKLPAQKLEPMEITKITALATVLGLCLVLVVATITFKFLIWNMRRNFVDSNTNSENLMPKMLE